MTTVLEEALLGRQNLPDNYVQAPNSADAQGNLYYSEFPSANRDYEGLVIDPNKAKSKIDSRDAIDITGSQRTRTVSPTIQNSVRSQADLDMDRIESQEGVMREKTPQERQADTLDDMLKDQRKNTADEKRSRQMLAGAKFYLNVMNAESAYSSFENSAILNIQNKRMQANDAIQRGRERAFEAEQEGRRLSDDVLIRMAAQGQDVSGLATESLQKSYEAVAAQNALQEETNSIREALGYQLEEVSINYELDQRKTQRDMSIISSALNYGASYYANS